MNVTLARISAKVNSSSRLIKAALMNEDGTPYTPAKEITTFPSFEARRDSATNDFAVYLRVALPYIVKNFDYHSNLSSSLSSDISIVSIRKLMSNKVPG